MGIFCRADCSYAVLIGNLTGAIFKDTNLNGIRFKLHLTMFPDCRTQLNNIDFSSCNLVRVDFSTLDLTGVNLVVDQSSFDLHTNKVKLTNDSQVVKPMIP